MFDLAPGVNFLKVWSISVVYSGSFHAFHVVFFPLEYIPTILPHSEYVIVNGFTWFQNKERLQDMLGTKNIFVSAALALHLCWVRVF